MSPIKQLLASPLKNSDLVIQEAEEACEESIQKAGCAMSQKFDSNLVMKFNN